MKFVRVRVPGHIETVSFLRRAWSWASDASQVVDTLSLALSQGLDTLGTGLAGSPTVIYLLAHHRGSLCGVCP